MGKINVLSFAVANLIAAGEVVDRPSSVIKELVENSIDSGAKQITVEIKNGGITYMRVSDNGCGIEAEDLPVAIKRHATSKIKTSDDLMKILTLGFRGEALAAIASVSDLRIISKTADVPYGAMIESHGGEIVEYSEQAARNGTTVIVENLFANIPARRKFLKRDATEGSAIATIIEKIALSHPEVAFRFISDGSVKLDTPGDGKLENVIYIIMGKQMQNAMIYIDSTINDIRVEGYIGRSDIVKSNRNYQNFFINNRYIKSKLAVAAIEQAYTSYLAPEKFPCCVLNLTINPSTVDINVHPTKLEVKFANEKPVFEAIYHSVKTALEENTTRPEIQIGASKNDSFSRMSSEQYRSIASMRPVSEAFAPIQNSQKEDKIEQIKYTDIPNFSNEAKVVTQTVLPRSQEESETVIPKEAYEMEEKYSNMPREEFLKLSPEEVIAVAINYYTYFQTEGEEDEEDIEFARLEENGIDPSDLDKPLIEVEAPAIPVYRIVGEVFNSYLIVEREDKMLIIDKHAAHERIIFEKNKEMMKSKEPSSQILISPLEVMLTSAEIAIVNDYLEDFEKLGFKLAPKKYSVWVYSIPTELSSCDVQDTVSTMVNRIKNGQGDAKITRDILFEKALYQASCKAAIKAGREYVEAHTEWIIEQLMKIPDITFCPHGRPVAMELSKKNLDYQFERS
ncbi:MAG: DNA mismatch repair endonuclease MutL [Clostridia bacterium]|nr:DNA mismatch repair endonuclease MutL [Clostridia bacterium]